MNNLVSYIKGLFPSFKRDKILDSVTSTRQMLVEFTIPSFETADELFSNHQFKSKKMKEFLSLYSNNVVRVQDQKFFSSIKQIMLNTVTLLDYIQHVSKNEFSDVETNVSLTYRKSTFLRTIQAAEFMSTYARKFLNYAFILETTEASEHTSVKDSLLQVEIDWVEKNFFNFCGCCQVLLVSKDKYKDSIDLVPASVITDLSEMTLPETQGLSKLDPLGMKNLSVTWSPIYLLGMVIAQMQANKYKAAQAELELVQMRKLHLQNIFNNTNDPVVEKQLAYQQQRVDDLQYKLHKMSEEYGL